MGHIMKIMSSLFILILAAMFILTGNSYAGDNSAREVAQIVAGVNKVSIIMNGIIRVLAIAAGAFIVWLGHNTLVRGVKGEFEFEGTFGKLKGSTPGLLFVLLGSLAIGWALKTPATGNLGAEVRQAERPAVTELHSSPGSSIPPADTEKKDKRPSDLRPDFLNNSGKEKTHE